MYIQATTRELKTVKSFNLPTKTRILEKANNNINTWRLWEVRKGGKWALIKDYSEVDRPWRGGEKEEFEKGLDKYKVLKFFVEQKEDDDVPYREYAVLSDKLSEYFKYFGNSGMYRRYKGRFAHNIFSLHVPSDTQLFEDTYKEISLLFREMKKKYGDKFASIPFSIMTNTDIYGSPELVWYPKKRKFVVQLLVFGKGTKKESFRSLKGALKYISETYPYHPWGG